MSCLLAFVLYDSAFYGTGVYGTIGAGLHRFDCLVDVLPDGFLVPWVLKSGATVPERVAFSA